MVKIYGWPRPAAGVRLRSSLTNRNCCSKPNCMKTSGTCNRLTPQIYRLKNCPGNHLVYHHFPHLSTFEMHQNRNFAASPQKHMGSRGVLFSDQRRLLCAAANAAKERHDLADSAQDATEVEPQQLSFRTDCGISVGTPIYQGISRHIKAIRLWY